MQIVLRSTPHPSFRFARRVRTAGREEEEEGRWRTRCCKACGPPPSRSATSQGHAAAWCSCRPSSTASAEASRSSSVGNESSPGSSYDPWMKPHTNLLASPSNPLCPAWFGDEPGRSHVLIRRIERSTTDRVAASLPFQFSGSHLMFRPCEGAIDTLLTIRRRRRSALGARILIFLESDDDALHGRSLRGILRPQLLHDSLVR